MCTFRVTTAKLKVPELFGYLTALGGDLIYPVAGKPNTFILAGHQITPEVIEDLTEQELIHSSEQM